MNKTPQEKKRLSYAKDRRNSYGENSKSSRKNVPRFKARSNRVERHRQEQSLSVVMTFDSEDALVAAEIRLKAGRPPYHQKEADIPLGEYLQRRR